MSAKDMRRNIAYCGLDCEQCDAYRATVGNDQVLRERTAKLWSELNNVEILPEQINCLGCRADGVKTVFCSNLCEIRKCAVKRSVETCGGCPDMEGCKTLAAVVSSNHSALKNLKAEK